MGILKRLKSHIGLVPNPVTARTREAHARTRGATASVSVCPYCAVGCSQLVYTKNGRIVDIEGNYESPINGGTLCPKGAATFQLVANPHRVTTVKYRPPYATGWQDLDLETAVDMIADRMIKTREDTWEDRQEMEGGEEAKLHRTLGFAHLGGATLDNEENYLMKKFYTAMGAVQIENQARI